MDNSAIARRLIGMAHELEGHGSNLYRVRAYRRAAEALLGLERPVAEILAESGPSGLRERTGIGASLSEKIAGLVENDETIAVV
jgi:DNA polymerase/3'-5' exonuclease PolX